MFGVVAFEKYPPCIVSIDWTSVTTKMRTIRERPFARPHWSLGGNATSTTCMRIFPWMSFVVIVCRFILMTLRQPVARSGRGLGCGIPSTAWLTTVGRRTYSEKCPLVTVSRCVFPPERYQPKSHWLRAESVKATSRHARALVNSRRWGEAGLRNDCSAHPQYCGR